MNQFAISTPEGTKDRLVSTCRKLRKTEKAITDVLKKRGYGEVITPSTEYYDVFLQADSSVGQEKMLKCTDRGGRILVMRPDSTTPIARIASTKIREEELPLRLFYSQKVYRSNPTGHGHSTEIMQIGAELLGADGMMADLDILSAAFEAMNAAQAGVYRIEIGHAGIYKALISSLGVTPEEAEEIRMLIENKSFAALGDALEPYADRPAYRALKAMPQLFGTAEVLEEAEKLTQNPQVLEAVAYLRRLYWALADAGFGDAIMIDLGLVHELDYYTGMMFRGYVLGAGGTIISGGRYNSLCAKFGRDIPATGFAIDLDGLSEAMPEEDWEQPAELVFTQEALLKRALAYIRENGAVLAPCGTEKEAMKMAKEQGYQALIVIDRDGVKRQEVK